MNLSGAFEMPSKTASSYSLNTDMHDARGTESGYVSGSGSSSGDTPPELIFTKAHLKFLNRQLQFLEPQGSVSLCFLR